MYLSMHASMYVSMYVCVYVGLYVRICGWMNICGRVTSYYNKSRMIFGMSKHVGVCTGTVFIKRQVIRKCLHETT